MKTGWPCFAAVLVFLAGCATEPPPPVTTYYDNTSGMRTDLLSENYLTSSAQPREVVQLNAARVFKDLKNVRSEYYLEVNYLAKAEVGYLDIPPGSSLTLVLDGQPQKFSGLGSLNSRKTMKRQEVDFVSEVALYPISKEHLQKIGLAKNVKVLIQGDKGLIEREFSPENYEKFRNFVTRYAL